MIHSHFASLIGRIRRALYREFEARVEEMCLTVPQFQVLNRLWEEDGILTSTLARDVGSDGGTITGILDRLEARGLVRRKRASSDRRKVYLYLTPEGRDLERPVCEIIQSLNETALAGFPPEERSHLLHLLERVSCNLGAEASLAVPPDASSAVPPDASSEEMRP